MQPAAAQYDLAFASLPEPTLLVDADGRLTGLNGAAEALLGPHVAEFVRAGEAVTAALPWLAPAVARVLGGEPEAEDEAEVATPAGRRWVAARLRRMTGCGGTLRGAVAVLEDETERRATDARVRSAERLAALGTLAAGIAHEVNNPLACVVAGLSFVEAEHERLANAVAGADLAEIRAALEEARAAALRVGRIVRSLQSFGGPAVPLLREVDLASAVRAAVELVEPELQGRARVTVDLVDGVEVRASHSALTELFVALLGHAADLLSAGPDADPALHVGLRVTDGEARVMVTGLGADEARAPASRALRHRPDLGLAVCHGIVSALGGSLVVDGAHPFRAAVVRLPLAA